MKKLTTILRIRENGGNSVSGYLESIVSDADKANEIAQKLQEANDLQDGEYKYVVSTARY